MITLDELKEKCRKFEEEEGRASFYDLALEIRDDHPLQAAVIILATWNAGRFRFMINDPQNLIDLKNALEQCKPLFEKLENKDFRTVNFNEIKSEVEEVYRIPSQVKGVEYTGASKIFHLFCRDLIVMWDSYIRKEYKKKEYEKEHHIKIKAASEEDFLNFQKLMQRIFGHLKWEDKSKTLPKAIDEHNYVMFTLPKLRKNPAN